MLWTAVAVRFPFCRTPPEFLIYEQSPAFGLLAVNRNEPIISELLGDYFTPVHAALSPCLSESLLTITLVHLKYLCNL